MLRVITSTSASARLDAAREFLARRPPAAEVVIVSASRGAADDLARSIALEAGALFGATRFSLTEMAARAAMELAARDHHAPGTQAGSEAMAARAAFEAVSAGELSYFAPVARLPGFPKALARTLHELRLAHVTRGGLQESAGQGLSDLSRLLARFEEALARAAVDDRSALFARASDACRAGLVRWARLPMLLLDVPIDSRAEQELVEVLASTSPDLLATVPDGDGATVAALRDLATVAEVDEDERADAGDAESDLHSLRTFVFRQERREPRSRAGDVSVFSAPGEGREAVEIVRRILDEAERGVPFDEMAVLLRAPQQYLGLLEHAGARGGVPMYFERGTRRPDPAGRAFVALLSCAVDGLSAKRFDEYLSLGQVPQVGTPPAESPADPPLVVPADEIIEVIEIIEAIEVMTDAGRSDASTARGGAADEEDSGGAVTTTVVDSDDEAVVAGTLRSPWKWEELIVESAVVGGRNRAEGKARWRRRLDGLKADYEYRISELLREEPDSARIDRLKRDLRNLSHLRTFALPIIDAMAEWPEHDTWGGWLDRFMALARRALRHPARVLRTLADLRPMADIGPVTVEQARDVLHDRLVSLDRDPPARRYGRVFVGTPHQARGRVFRIVFVPGLAERVVPQRPREDPLLLDGRRQVVDAALVTLKERGAAERLLLKIAIGAARDRLYLSYPRLDVSETRARVPSFYALDVMRAITGEVPDHRVLASSAAEEGGASLAWPAPRDPDRAIDDLEHDLAVLKPLLDTQDRAAVKGRAHYLLGLNAALRRSVASRWLREKSAWSTADGLIRVADGTRAMLDKSRLAHRPYSLSALQRFAVCPYQFLLATIYRLEPWDEPEPLVRMDPLTRGSLFHAVQAGFYREMQARNALPIRPEGVASAARTLDGVLDRVTAEYAEMLAPAIDRVWRDEIEELRRDLGIWIRKIADTDDWEPLYFEFSFGLSDDGRDPRSLTAPVVVDGRFVLRGSVDLIERRAGLDVLRVTDHKTGKNRSTPDLIVGGGTMLQPVLYSVAIEQGLQTTVAEGRLFYATTAGGFATHAIPITEYTRRQGLQVLEIVDRAVQNGFLAPVPAERACAWCDFRAVCGPREEDRTARKAADRLADLQALRSMR
jgi:CRISPR/Cas system-associated exonuclease Cas4 (RecB family)